VVASAAVQQAVNQTVAQVTTTTILDASQTYITTLNSGSVSLNMNSNAPISTSKTGGTNTATNPIGGTTATATNNDTVKKLYCN
jgi:hypothetical protein